MGINLGRKNLSPANAEALASSNGDTPIHPIDPIAILRLVLEKLWCRVAAMPMHPESVLSCATKT